MGKRHCNAAMFVGSFTGIPGHLLLETSCSPGLGWSCSLQPGSSWLGHSSWVSD